jgi:plastocyanin
MKNTFALLALTTALSFSPFAQAKEFEVKMKSISYDPKVIEIHPGDTIVWSNISYTDHSALGENFDSGLVRPKTKSKPVSFAETGSFPYHCKIHGLTMSGIVKVSQP